MRALIALFAVVSATQAAVAAPPLGSIIEGKPWVIDGDTVVIGDAHIRLKGLDAPELDAAYGQASKHAMIEIARRGRWRCTVLEINPPKNGDKERAVCSCAMADGDDPVEIMIAEGMGKHWRYWTRRYPELRARYDAAEKKAKAARLGIWRTLP